MGGIVKWPYSTLEAGTTIPDFQHPGPVAVLTPDDVLALGQSIAEIEPAFPANLESSPLERLDEMSYGLMKDQADIAPLPHDSRAELVRFWAEHPDMRQECTANYGHDPVEREADYWRFGIAEPEHADVLDAIKANGGLFTLDLVKRWEAQEIAEASVEKAAIIAAGIAVRAADTGRVLMIQRAANPTDPASGTWEFPGGLLEADEHPLDAARREFREEMGIRLPKGRHAGQWRSAVYQGFVHEVKREKTVKLNTPSDSRRVKNPDDPDGDNAEVAAWWHPEQLRRMSALRPELRQSKAWTQVEKAGAPGLAGRIPPAGDEGTDENYPDEMTLDKMEAAAAAGTSGGSGPSASSVHVNKPLKNVSQGYMQGPKPRKRGGKPVLVGEFLPVTKAGKMKQLVYGVVLEPNSFDSQDDFMLPHHVEETAHGYLKKAIRGQSSVAKLQHRGVGFRKDRPSIVPVESFIAPCDFTPEGGTEMIKKGSWVMCMHVEDSALWQDFLDGKYQAFSVGGTGVRQSLHSPIDISAYAD